MIKVLYTSEGRELNNVLAGTGKLMTLHGILLSAGLLI
jgi:1,4-dihydroxy-2-naphthoate octaprenyltransferase